MMEISEKLWLYLERLSKQKLINVMGDALNLMQQWNGRTITYCIIHALDGLYNEETKQYSLPKLNVEDMEDGIK